MNTVTKEHAVALAKQKEISKKVKLLSIDYNWGAPISERADVDSMNMWVKVAGSEKGKLFLHGKDINGSWDINTQFKKIGSYKEKTSPEKFSLYSISKNTQNEFPTEFVIKFENENGEHIYDNNNNGNYSVKPYSGYGSSVICNDKAIFDLGEIQPYTVCSVKA